MDLDLIESKFRLANSDVYKQLREFQLQHILELSNSAADPLLIKGMLKCVRDTDKWIDDFKEEKIKQKERNL